MAQVLLWLGRAILPWLLLHAGRMAASLLLGYLAWKADVVWNLFLWGMSKGGGAAAGDLGSLLQMPELESSWSSCLCAANGWIPLAEAWRLFFVYWIWRGAMLAVRIALKLFGK